MPAQTSQGQAVYYIEFDTAPDIRVCLKDGAGEPIDLTGSEVFMSAAFSMPRGTYYTSPRDNIIHNAPCTFDPDQSIEHGERGWVNFTPGTDVGVDAMTPPGEFLYQFEIHYPNGGVQTVPPNTYLPLVIKTKVGGRQNNPGG